jgi:xanthine dehydrogenase accessory factor
MTWYKIVQQLESNNEDYVLITVLGTVGSTPRDCGTKMVVSKARSYGTIGGGHLEYKAIDRANQLLEQSDSCQKIEHFPLGAKLGQCCGGNATLMFESFINANIDIMLFGAGHVGKALTSILSELPCKIHWVDSREEEFPEELPSNVTKVVSDTPSDEVSSMRDNGFYVVMTHNHPLDFEITEAILLRDDARYVGLIGSQTKWQRFKMRFRHKGYKPEFYSSIHCPIGLRDIPGKLPTEVAVAVAGEIIAEYHREYPDRPKRRGVDWKQLRIGSVGNLETEPQELRT